MAQLTIDDPRDAAAAADPPDWRGPETCPFCGADLADGGPAFVAHLDRSDACRAGFGAWRERVVDDVRGEWSG